MTDMDFADELEDDADAKVLDPWIVMIVDDEVAVHQVTRLVMSDFELNGRRVEFLDAYSAAEGREVLRARKDVALILLDVVMETNHCGNESLLYMEFTGRVDELARELL